MKNRFIKSLKQKIRRSSGKKGFTLMETMVTAGIIALLAAIAIPSAISINRSLENRSADDYAEAIYLAAQTQLSAMRAEEPVALSATLSTSADPIPETGNAGLGDAWSSDLRYAVSGRDQAFLDSTLLPVGSIDETVRDKKILIEYNYLTGEVRSVFFLNETASASDYLTYGSVTRSTDERRAIHLGYYQADTFSNITEPESYTEDLYNCEILSFYNNYDNNGDGVIKVLVPIPEGYRDTNRFADSLSVMLTITGKTSGARKTVDLTGDVSGRAARLTDTGLRLNGSSAVGYSYILDSIYTAGYTFDELVRNSGFQIGENVTLSVEITDTSDVTTFEGTPQSLTINPLYAELSGSTLLVANARNLQNLNKFAASDEVKTVKLGDSIDWYDEIAFTPLTNECGFQVFDGNGKTISGLTINDTDSTIIGNSVGFFTALTAESKDSMPVVQNLTLDELTIDLQNSAGKSVGAIVGSATDVKLSNCTATDIDFTLYQASASTSVGGLVGVMKGGTLEGNAAGNATTVSGTITKSSGTTGYVGGAVGKDETGKFSAGSSVDSAVYSRVNADVELESWGGTVSPASAGDPSGLGVNVGQFIGYVRSGAFSDCSGTGGGDMPYQFLGQIAYSISELSGTYFASINAAQKNYSSENEGGTYTSLAAYAESKGMTPKTSRNDYTASLTNCTFQGADALCRQVIASEYLYSGKEGDGTFKVENCGAKIITSITKSNLSSDRDNIRYIIYDITNDAILPIPDIDGNKTSTYPSPEIGSEGLLITKENSASCTKGNYGWGLNDFRYENNMLFFAYSGGYDIRFAKGYFYDVSGGSMDIYQYGNGEFTFLDTYNSTYYLKFDPTTRVYNVTKASSKSTPPDDAPHFVLIQYNVKQLADASAASSESGAITLKITHNPNGFILDLQEANASHLCTSEAIG